MTLQVSAPVRAVASTLSFPVTHRRQCPSSSHTADDVLPAPVMLSTLQRGLSDPVLGHGHGLLAWPADCLGPAGNALSGSSPDGPPVAESPSAELGISQGPVPHKFKHRRGTLANTAGRGVAFGPQNLHPRVGTYAQDSLEGTARRGQAEEGSSGFEHWVWPRRGRK